MFIMTIIGIFIIMNYIFLFNVQSECFFLLNFKKDQIRTDDQRDKRRVKKTINDRDETYVHDHRRRITVTVKCINRHHFSSVC